MRLLPLLLLLCACPSEEPREAGQFVDHEDWAVTDADPWPDHAPDPIECPELAWSYETQGGEPSLEVRTDDCNYLVVEQTSIREALPGDELQFRLWHFDLVQFDPAEAHIGVQVDGRIVFEVTVPIPSSSEMISEEFAVQQAIPEGSPVVLHLHNHGANTWNMVEMSVNPPEAVED